VVYCWVLRSHYRTFPDAFAVCFVILWIHVEWLIIGFVALNDENVVNCLAPVDLVLESDFVRNFFYRGLALQDSIPEAIHTLARKLVL